MGLNQPRDADLLFVAIGRIRVASINVINLGHGSLLRVRLSIEFNFGFDTAIAFDHHHLFLPLVYGGKAGPHVLPITFLIHLKLM
jgi:hypothetical protein